MKRLLVLGFIVALVAVGVGAVLATQSVSADRAFSGPGPGRYKGSEPPFRITLPSFVLHESNGTRVVSSALTGKVVLVTFLETKCREACPIIADQIGMALGRLTASERRRVDAIAISVHPHDDTASSVRRFLRVHRVQGELRYLIGSEAELRPVWRAFYVAAALDSGDADTHSASVRVFDTSNKWVSTLHPGVDLTPSNLAHDVRIALRSP
jgi:protein SCO1/2